MTDTAAAREITITRVYEAPRELVWRAWTEPELIKRWWSGGGAHGEVTSVEVDLRVGGAWRYVVRGDHGTELGWSGTYREIEPHERLVSTEWFELAPAGSESVNTATLTETDGRTTLTVLVQHRSKANRDGHLESGMEAGMQVVLDELEKVAISLR